MNARDQLDVEAKINDLAAKCDQLDREWGRLEHQRLMIIAEQHHLSDLRDGHEAERRRLRLSLWRGAPL